MEFSEFATEKLLQSFAICALPVNFGVVSVKPDFLGFSINQNRGARSADRITVFPLRAGADLAPQDHHYDVALRRFEEQLIDCLLRRGISEKRNLRTGSFIIAHLNGRPVPNKGLMAQIVERGRGDSSFFVDVRRRSDEDAKGNHIDTCGDV